MTGPGDVVISTFGMGGKSRPWMVLWIDDVLGMCCVVALTSKRDYVGAVRTGHHVYSTAAAWVSIQPLRMVDNAKRTGVTLPRKARRTISKHLHTMLDLRDPLDA